MERKIMIKLFHAEYYEDGKEIEDLSILKGCKILDVEDGNTEDVILTVEIPEK